MNRATSPTGWARNPDGTLGWIWNPISGCLNHDNGLCKGGGFPCYASKLANGRLKPLYLENKNLAPVDYSSYKKFDGELSQNVVCRAFADPFYPRFWEQRAQKFHDQRISNKSKGIFICDMGDLFGIGIPELWTAGILKDISSRHSQHRFYLLTKQPQNLIKFSPFPENAWVGVTATNYDYFVDACGILGSLKAKGGVKVAFVSLEPLLSWEDTDQFCQFWFQHGGIDWLIIGACTGTHLEMLNLYGRLPDAKAVRIMPYGNKWTLQPKIESIREIVEAADKAGVKVFLKDNLKPLIECPRAVPWAFDNLSNIPRQELPK